MTGANAIKRDIVINIKLQSDDGNAAAIAAMRKQLGDALGNVPVGVSGTAASAAGRNVPGADGGRAGGGGAGASDPAGQAAWARLQQQKREELAQQRIDKAAGQAAWQKLQEQKRVEVQAERQRQSAMAEQQRQQKSAQAIEIKRSQDAARQQQAAFAQRSNVREAAQSGLAALKGGLDVVKNVAILSISSEKDLDKLLKKWVQLTAAFEAGKGAITVVMNLTKALDSLRKAQIAGSIASGVSAGASALQGAAGAGGLFGMVKSGIGGLRNLATPGGIVGAAGRLSGMASRAWGVAGPLAGIAGGVAAGDWLSSRFSADGKGTIGTGIEAGGTWWRENNWFGRGAELNAAIRERSTPEGIARRQQERDSRVDRTYDLRARARQDQFDARVRSTAGMSAEGAAATMVLGARRDVSSARGALREFSSNSGDGLNNLQEQVRLNEQLVEAQQRLYDAEQMSLQAIRAKLQERRQETQELQNQQRLAEQAQKSGEARLGSLDPAMRQEVTRISEKIQGGGTLTQRERDALSQSGFGQRFTSEFDRGKLNERDREAVRFLEGFQTKDERQKDLAIAQGRERSLMNEEKRAEGKVGQAADGLTEAQRSLTEAQNAASGLNVGLEKVTTSAEKLSSTVETLQSKMEGLQKSATELDSKLAIDLAGKVGTALNAELDRMQRNLQEEGKKRDAQWQQRRQF